MKTNLRAGTQAADTFARFIRSLGTDNFRVSTIGLLVAIALLVGWTIWLVNSRVTLYEVTAEARLEAEQAGYSVESALAGRLVSTKLSLGQEVEAGDVLATLDTDEQQRLLDEENARLSTIAPQIDGLNKEIAVEQQAIDDARQAARGALAEAQSRVEEADAAARFSEEETHRLSTLLAQGYIAELEVMRVRAEARSRRANVQSLKHTITKLEREQQTQETERRVRIEKLSREKTGLEGQLMTLRATIARLQNDIERRTIRAPAAGQLGEITSSRTGAVVREGDKLGTVLPHGELKIVAEFPPSVLGRIREGQAARMRLTSFPWTQYGSVAATVNKVASEVRNGTIRVELAVVSNTSIPVQHGLPGTIEIEVERISPATLLLRTIKFLNRPALKENNTTGAQTND